MIAHIAQSFQTIVDIEKSRVADHRFISETTETVESENPTPRQVFRTAQLVENAIRPIALTRKNALFAGHEVGAENWALLASIVATCKLTHINPTAYITGTLQANRNGHLQIRIEELMPWRFPMPSTHAP